jgi:hypothetical protein
MDHDHDDDDRRNRFLAPAVRERAASQPPHQTMPQHLPVWNPLRGAQSRTSNAHFSSAIRFSSTFEDDEDSESFTDPHDELYIPSSRGRTTVPDPTRSRSQSLATTRPGLIGSPYHRLGVGPSWHDPNNNLSNIPESMYGDIKPPGSSRYGSLGALGASSPNIHNSLPSGGPVVANGYSHRMDLSNMSPFVRDVGQILDDGSTFRDIWAGMNHPRDENGGGGIGVGIGGGGGSGTTSRRHSVSVVQPRRVGNNIVGFNAPGTADGPDEYIRPFQQSSAFGRGGLMLSDDDLASDLNMLSLSPGPSQQKQQQQQQHHQHHQHPPSQPSSLPIYVPLSRSPLSSDLVSPFQSIALNSPLSSSFASRAPQRRASPTESGLEASGGSPTRAHYDPLLSAESPYGTSTQQRQALTARFVPGHGIQYLPLQQHQQQQHLQSQSQSQSQVQPNISNFGGSNNGIAYGHSRGPSYPSSNTLPSPISPTGTRPIKPQQPPYYPSQIQRRLSDTTTNQPQQPPPQAQASLSELGRGVPLHAVPASWPLYIVEFKAGRTDLFYLTDLTVDVRVGDLVIVEADRGKDLGKVVNDTITLAEVEAFQREQIARVGFGDGQPMSPGGAGSGAGANTTGGGTGASSGKKEINPKMIYGKAQHQDTQ